jgi:hypothetical protein
VRLEAVDALADGSTPRAAEALARIAIDAGDPSVRKDATEHLDED